MAQLSGGRWKMAETTVSDALKNTLRAIRKLAKAGKPVTQDQIAVEMGRSDSAASTHLKRAQELKLVTKKLKNGRVVPGSYRLTPKGEEALGKR
jgi:Mn-dependent DtxR family transcriptional regulator